MNEPATAAAPERLGPCHLIRAIGKGGMGTVYLAEMIEDRPYAPCGSPVAVKVLHPQFLFDPDRVERLQREARIGIELAHPGIVTTYEIARAASGSSVHHFIVMEYVEGQTLRQFMNEMKVVSEALLRHLAAQVARSLEAIHKQGVAHRDVKPDNVLVTKDHVVKLMDLGIAVAFDRTILTLPGQFVGTLRYAAPEHFGVGTMGFAADLYSLGVTFYEAATNTTPFDAETFAAIMRRHLTHVPPKAGSVNPQITPFFEEVLACLLQKDSSSRFAAAGELADALEAGESSLWWQRRENELRLSQQRKSPRRLRIQHLTSMVGRGVETGTLHSLFRDAKSGSGRLLLIEGEAGIGKSRLTDEFADYLEADPENVTVLHGAYPPYSVEGAHGGLNQAVVNHFGENGLQENLARYLTVTPRLIPAFASHLLGAPAPLDSEPLSRDGLHAVFCYLARGLAAKQTVVWIVEDLQFASAGDRAVLLSLAGIAHDQRILLIATTRPGLPPEELVNFDRLALTRRMSLGRLSNSQLAELLIETFHSDALAREFVKTIGPKSDGNPFFAIEILKDLKKSSAVVSLPDGSYAAAQDVAAIKIPASIREVLMSRLQGVSAEDRELLEVGAVQGFSFDPDLIARTLDKKRLEALQRLAEIERRLGVVRATGAGFEFDHHQLQEFIYSSIAPMLRVEYHALLAFAFETRSKLANREPQEVPGNDAVFLAVHFLKGRQEEAGLRLVLRALDHLESDYRNEAILELSTLALQALGRDQPDLRCDIRLREARCLARLGRQPAQRAAVEGAIAACESTGDQNRIIQARHALGLALLDVCDYGGASDVLQDTLQRAETIGNKRSQAEAIAGLGDLRLRCGQFEDGLKYLNRQLALSKELGDRGFEANALAALGLVFVVMGKYQEAINYLEGQLAALGDSTAARSRVHYSIGLAAEYLGQNEAAHSHHKQCLESCREIGYRHGEALSLIGIGRVLRDAGRLDEAQKQIENGLEIGRAIQGRHVEGYALLYLGDVDRARQRTASARTLYERALQIFRGIGAQQGVAEAAFALGRLLVDLGELISALPLIEEADQLSHELALHIMPGLLPAAYLALLGNRDPASVAVPETTPAASRAEAHLILFRAGADPKHLQSGAAIVRQLNESLRAVDRDRFWDANPTARMLRSLESS